MLFRSIGGEMKLSDNNGMSGDQITNILKHYVFNYNGCYMKDELRTIELKNGWYVVNMQSSTQGSGTHWCAFKYSNSLQGMCIWFDSFGIIPPVDVLVITQNNLIYNNQQIQDYNSSCCGYFSIACIVYDNPHLTAEISLNRFIHRFSQTTIINDEILKKLLYSKGITTRIKL